jgi:protein-disulfide isomerase
MNRNTIVITVLSIIAIFGLLFGVYYATNTPEAPVLVESMKTVNPGDHTKWAKNSKNVLVEYFDLQCPACKAYHDIIKSQIETSPEITGKITFVHRHFPLYQAHPNAQSAAYAAEAAGKQGKFFEMVDAIFAQQQEWSQMSNPSDTFLKIATELELDLPQFKRDLSSQAVKDKVASDAQSGNAVGVSSTPTFYLNGQKLSNINSFEEFKILLSETAK